MKKRKEVPCAELAQRAQWEAPGVKPQLAASVPRQQQRQLHSPPQHHIALPAGQCLPLPFRMPSTTAACSSTATAAAAAITTSLPQHNVDRCLAGGDAAQLSRPLSCLLLLF